MRGFEKGAIDAPQSQKQLKLALDANRRSGYTVMTTSDSLTVGYVTPQGEKPLVRTPALELHREEFVALMGANGSGKTTLLRTIVGELPSLAGRVDFGVGVSVGYYSQIHDELIFGNTILEEVHRIKPLEKTERIRTLLGRFLFSNDDIFKRVGDLSGGERSRVALAQLTIQSPNLLILDEPTNHLDIASREALESVLQEFPGTILFVSHDRYFIDALADKIWMVENGTVSEFQGGYTEYVDYVTKVEAERKRVVDPQTDSRPPSKNNGTPAKTGQGDGKLAEPLTGREHRDHEKQQRERQKRLNALERQVADLERQLHVLQGALEEATAQRKIDDIARLGEEYVQLEQKLQTQYDLWAELAQ
jgi:ATP-binding cassette subfamily F protein 3